MKFIKKQLSSVNIVIGGGIIGLLVAWYLSKAGERVVVLDRQKVGCEASWSGAGVLTPIYPDNYPSLKSLFHDSFRYYEEIVVELEAFSQRKSELTRCGLICLDNSSQYSSKSLGQEIDRAALSKIEPQLAVPNGVSSRYFCSGHIRNPRFLKGLRSILELRGVEFKEYCEVTGFVRENKTLIGIHIKERASGRIVQGFNRCIVTAGAWSRSLLLAAGLDLPIYPIRGQIIVVKAPAGMLSNIIAHNYRYLVPRADGKILVGSTVENVGFDKSTSPIVETELYAAATFLVPALNKYPVIHHWSGLRPGSPDDAPFIGECPELKGLFVCAGHYRNGFATGPASARLLVDIMLGWKTAVDPAPFRLNRSRQSERI